MQQISERLMSGHMSRRESMISARPLPYWTRLGWTPYATPAADALATRISTIGTMIMVRGWTRSPAESTDTESIGDAPSPTCPAVVRMEFKPNSTG